MYKAKVIDTKSYGKGSWNCTIVGIFDENDNQIGEYERKYHSFGESTFHPFERDGEWYALYSADYTCTRLMKLPECKDIGGEKGHAGGFCPVDYFIPRYRKCTHTYYHNGEKRKRTLEYYVSDADEDMGLDGYNLEDYHNHPDVGNGEVGPIKYYDFGFIAGCIWGDDSSWKVQLIDLRKAHKGKIKRNGDILGYLQLPRNLSLREAVIIDDMSPEYPHFMISQMNWVRFDLDQL